MWRGICARSHDSLIQARLVDWLVGLFVCLFCIWGSFDWPKHLSISRTSGPPIPVLEASC